MAGPKNTGSAIPRRPVAIPRSQFASGQLRQDFSPKDAEGISVAVRLPLCSSPEELSAGLNAAINSYLIARQFHMAARPAHQQEWLRRVHHLAGGLRRQLGLDVPACALGPVELAPEVISCLIRRRPIQGQQRLGLMAAHYRNILTSNATQAQSDIDVMKIVVAGLGYLEAQATAAIAETELKKGGARRPDQPMQIFMRKLAEVFATCFGRPIAPGKSLHGNPSGPGARFVQAVIGHLKNCLRENPEIGDPRLPSELRRITAEMIDQRLRAIAVARNRSEHSE